MSGSRTRSTSWTASAGLAIIAAATCAAILIARGDVQGAMLLVTLLGAYHRHILGRVRAAGGWITYHQGLSREALSRLIAANRYGIHGMRGEHFGIAVADLVRGGCVVFVPEDGGPREIVGSDPRLLYRSAADAVDKIRRVLKDPGEQAGLQAHLAARPDLFSESRFMDRVRDMVANFPAV